VLKSSSRANFLGVATAISLLLIQLPGHAAASPDQLTASIYKAKILAPGTQIKVKVQGEQALISTFRNERADDKDSKIDALLLGKTIFETPGSGITSIVVYFYNSRAANEYKTVTIRTGDVKAFDAGQMSQDELLSSIEIKGGKVQDTATAIESRMMLSAAARRDFQTVDRGEEIEVSCKMPALSEEEYKLEAFRIASTALDYIGSTGAAKRVKVIFFDPAEKGKFKQVTISLSNLQTIQKQLAAAFGTLQLSAGVSKLTTKDIEASEGPMLKERTALLARIQNLEDKGVGVAPFIQAYQGLDSRVGSIDATTLGQEITRLGASVTEQEKRYESAKTLKFSKDDTPVADAGVGRIVGDVKEPRARGSVSRWALGFFPLLATDIVRDPDNYLADCKKKFEAETKKKAEEDKRYALALLWFAEVLTLNNHADQAKKFESEGRVLASRFKK
jgi:hypothetical protein